MISTERDIAIIGSACRFPGNASSPSKLWELLQHPVVVASEVPFLKGYYHPQHHQGHTNVKEAYLLTEENAHQNFDAAFFGIKPDEANVLDPQARLLLETVYEGLEAGGQTMETLRGTNTAVYIGQMVNDYELVMYRDQESMGKYHATGTSRTMMSNRISYFFDWHGPSMTIDTACSSSLAALHQGIQQLRSGHSRVAIVAGSNLILDPASFIAESSLQMLSPDGRCRMWDAEANGYARGEGVAAVVLKTRKDAEADGDLIDCIIRETALGQDGKTLGQTMPNASAQCQLIRDCYDRAGLDLNNSIHRPQYFEAHGTGTLAGDRTEAEAIASAFFPNGKAAKSPLIVGGIKTVIGHTEGAAGLAGILKASLALKHSSIPPNLLFQRLNPEIESFYENLHIPTSLEPWPEVESGNPRRVSVNSFGFGGSNAHAILESYEAQKPTELTCIPNVYTPFVFSAASETSLKYYLAAFSHYLLNNPNANIRDIAYSLHTRRSRLSVATYFAASSACELSAAIEMKLEASRSDERVGVRVVTQIATSEKPRILGIFTGQGAQWAQMGLDLVMSSPTCRRSIVNLQNRLDKLPMADRPTWSLLDELGKDSHATRIMDAAFSQPLCTAIQILQIDILHAAGIEFSAVVGHSSGEISAAYAAGLISAEDAICISYYRGLYSQLSEVPQGQRGVMMAVGTSAHDASHLLSFDEFKGRASLAAVNSATSVTISGDQDAVEELKVVFEDEKRFTRILKVDKAYHSHHMTACSARYLESLDHLDMKLRPGNKTAWFSSVSGSVFNMHQSLKGPYWDNNMLQPVLFMQAIDAACVASGSFNLAIELGPHMALRGPTLETIRGRTSRSIPYTSVFTRGTSGITSLAHSLGYAWTLLGGDNVNLNKYDQYLSNSAASFIGGLPTYAWDHENKYWHESRYAKAIRLRPDPVHELLGHLTPNSTEHDMRWRHILCPTKIPWLTDHKLQNMIVFPAAGYVSTVLEAALILCKGDSATRIEVLDIEIVSALVFDREDSSVEVLISITNVSNQNETLQAEFKYHAASKNDSDPLQLKASGRLRISFGSSDHSLRPARLPCQPNLAKESEKNFYKSMFEMGYQYTGQFQALERIERKLGVARGFISKARTPDLLIHPAVLDVAFQSTFLTHSAPGDGAINSMLIPRRVQSITIDPKICSQERASQTALSFDAFEALDVVYSNMFCDIDIYSGVDEHAMIRVQGLQCVPFSHQTDKNDREVFASVTWGVANPDAQLIASPSRPSALGKTELATLLDRVAVFSLRRLDLETPLNHPARFSPIHKNLFQFASQIALNSSKGKLTYWKLRWQHDTIQTIDKACASYAETIDMKVLSQFRAKLVAVARGDEAGVEESLQEKLTKQWYSTGLGLKTSKANMTRLLKQIVHRYPRMHILELGAKMGTATDAILGEIGTNFASYTMTSQVATAFNMEQEWPELYKERMTWKQSDLSKNLREQGFLERSYDLIVAPLALYSYPDLEHILCNIRQILKPGGYLLALEILPTFAPFFGAILGTVPHRLLVDPDISLSPAVSLEMWDELLRRSGFSGIDTSIPDGNGEEIFSVFVSQAMDQNIAFIREPLLLDSSLAPRKPMIEDLVILSGCTSGTDKLTDDISNSLKPFCVTLRVVRTFTEFLAISILDDAVILSLADTDSTICSNLNDVKWKTVQKILTHVGTVAWVTQGQSADNPHGNMMLGLLRGAARDNPALNYLLLDIDGVIEIGCSFISKALLRYRASSMWLKDSILMTLENELMIDKTGRHFIPRLIMSGDMNDRYNSNHRNIRRSIYPKLHNLCLFMSDSGWDIALGPHYSHREDKSNLLTITHSLNASLRVAEFDFMNLSFGTCSAGNTYITLSSKNNSKARIQELLSVAIHVLPGSEARFIWLTAHHVLSCGILKGLSEGDEILILEPSVTFASVIAEQAAVLGVLVKFATTNDQCSSLYDSRWILLDDLMSKRALERVAHNRVSVFVDMTTTPETLGSRIVSLLQKHSRKFDFSSLFGTTAWNPKTGHLPKIRHRLTTAVAWASNALKSRGESVPMITIDSVREWQDSKVPLTILKWDVQSKVSLRVRPIESQLLFSDDKTYWLAGLTGGLGLSLCEWMVKQGARYFVLSSRNPTVELAWIDEMCAKRVCVKICACDITVRDQVIALYSEICSSMPAIAGVAQGAMVLEDTNVQNMTLEQLLKVTQPKVEGSTYLDELFQENTLDFFVFFSSVSSVIGNHGQANYAAGNMFMASLAEQRRRKGLAASVLNLGAIFGVGYLAQPGNSMSSLTMRTTAFVGTCERDFHQLFGEAVLAGRPGSRTQIELVSGLRKVGLQEEFQPIWASWPRMSHFVSGEGGFEKHTGSTEAKISPKDKLELVIDYKEVHEIVWDAFTDQLGSLFHHDVRKVGKNELGATRLDQMGIDSLTAVEIRSWFVKTFDVNIPVLKILNGGLVSELVESATRILSSRLGIKSEDSPTKTPGPFVPTAIHNISTATVVTEHEIPVPLSGSTRESQTKTSSGAKVLRSYPVSFTQARFYPSGLFLEDKVGLNHTAWARIIGEIDVEQLQNAVRDLGEQHEILRTAFFDQHGQQMQHILETSLLHLEYQTIDNEEEVEQIAMRLQKSYVYDVGTGETMRLLLLSRSATENYLVAGIHPLIMDGTSFQIFWKWLAFHYSHPQVKVNIKQFAQASEERRADYAAGKYASELKYWREEFSTPPNPLPLMSIATVNERPILKSYENIRAACEISIETKLRISHICRRLRATPFHFYLAAFRALLLSNTIGGEDTTMAVAESGRSHCVEEMDVIGPLYNLVLVRLYSCSDTKFEDLLEKARLKMYTGLSNSKMPYSMVVKELDLQKKAKYFPFFQTFVDYRMGQRERMPWGENNQLLVMGFDLNVPYDIYLDTVDEPNGVCLHNLFLRKDLFDQPGADRLAKSYKYMIERFAESPNMTIGGIGLSSVDKME